MRHPPLSNPGKRPPREAAKAARRQQIIDATRAIVAEKGYNGFGLQEVAARCSLTKPGLLHHFASKEALLLAVLRDCDARDRAIGEEIGTPLPEAGIRPDLARGRFLEGMRRLLAHNLTDPEMLRFYAVLRVEALNPRHPAHAALARREAGKLAILAECLTGWVEHPMSGARQLLAMLSGLEEQWLREGDAFDLPTEWDRALERLFPAQPAAGQD